jgi:hypothetical protein
MSQVYLSYSHYDRETASKLKRQIINFGFSTGLDRVQREAVPISSEDERAERLYQWIEESELLLFLVSSNSVGSGTVHKEVGIAREKDDGRILAVIVDEVDELPKIRNYAGVLYYSEGDEFQQKLYSVLVDQIGVPSTAIMDLEAQQVAWLESDTGARFALTKNSNVIGRDPSADVDLTPLDDRNYVSRKHATFEFRDGKWHMHADMPVSNETLVNGEVLKEGSLRALDTNDEIRLGAIKLKFVTK